MWNLIKTLTLSAFFGSTTMDEFQSRLAVCDDCYHRNEMFCVKCGCHIPSKASIKNAECPLRKWKDAQR